MILAFNHDCSSFKNKNNLKKRKNFTIGHKYHNGVHEIFHTLATE